MNFLTITKFPLLINYYPPCWPRGRGWWWGYGYPFFFGSYWGPIIMGIVFLLLLYLAYQLGKRSSNNKNPKEIITKYFSKTNDELLKEIVERIERLEKKEQQNNITRDKS